MHTQPASFPVSKHVTSLPRHSHTLPPPFHHLLLSSLPDLVSSPLSGGIQPGSDIPTASLPRNASQPRPSSLGNLPPPAPLPYTFPPGLVQSYKNISYIPEMMLVGFISTLKPIQISTQRSQLFPICVHPKFIDRNFEHRFEGGGSRNTPTPLFQGRGCPDTHPTWFCSEHVPGLPPHFPYPEPGLYRNKKITQKEVGGAPDHPKDAIRHPMRLPAFFFCGSCFNKNLQEVRVPPLALKGVYTFTPSS